MKSSAQGQTFPENIQRCFKTDSYLVMTRILKFQNTCELENSISEISRRYAAAAHLSSSSRNRDITTTVVFVIALLLSISPLRYFHAEHQETWALWHCLQWAQFSLDLDSAPFSAKRHLLQQRTSLSLLCIIFVWPSPSSFLLRSSFSLRLVPAFLLPPFSLVCFFMFRSW